MLSPNDGPGHEALREALLAYYDRAARALPWRGETDPYRVLVSEVMLQQTRVDTVIRYYGRWLDRFPDLETLAAADEDEVLKAWEGLGYYRRATNLHQTARVVWERGDVALPSEYDGLRALPGVGDYTAGAVASIAFGQAAPAVDGNVRRVLSRLYDVAEPRASWLRATAADLVEPQRPGDWNQALMDLGATVCTPRRPRCGVCPVSDWCAAHAAGTTLDRPVAARKRRVRTVHLVLGVFHVHGRLLLVRRPPRGLLAGMWAFPEVEVEADGSPLARPATDRCLGALDEAAQALGLVPIDDPRELPPREHRFTHLHAIYLPWSVELGVEAIGDGRVWVRPSEAEEVAMPLAQRRVLESWVIPRSVRTPRGNLGPPHGRAVP